MTPVAFSVADILTLPPDAGTESGLVIDRESVEVRGLLDRAKAGDQAAFGRLVDLHQRVVYRTALAALGRREEARERYQDALLLRNSYGLLAEDVHPQTGALWGNFPQTYSMAGVILSAMRLSQSWEDRYWRASS